MASEASTFASLGGAGLSLLVAEVGIDCAQGAFRPDGGVPRSSEVLRSGRELTGPCKVELGLLLASPESLALAFTVSLLALRPYTNMKLTQA